MIRALYARLNRTLDNREPGVDFLRGLAILSVVFLHFNMIYKFTIPTRTWLFSFYFWPEISRNGYLGVSAFFVISGYLITSGSLNRFENLNKVSFFDFYTLRFARIVPPLVMLFSINVLLYLLDEPTFVFNYSKVTPWEFIYGIMTLQIWDMGVFGFSVGVLWSLTLEELFYVIFPVMCRILRKPVLIVSFLVGSIVYATYYRSTAGQYAAMFNYFGIFDLLSLGCLLAIFKTSYPQKAKALRSKWLNGAALLMGFIVYVASHDKDHHIVNPALMGASVALFILSAEPGQNSVYTSKLATWVRILGVYSYEIYLSHIIVTQLMTTHVLQELDSIPIFSGVLDFYVLLVVVATAFVSMLFSEFYSEPLRRIIIRCAQGLKARVFNRPKLVPSADGDFGLTG